jgi:hypothetical protein
MENERTVGIAEATDEQAAELMEGEPRFYKGVSKAIPRYKEVTNYTNFKAEYALIEKDLVLHFYETPERPVKAGGYWHSTFPAVLDKVGQEYFQATAPRLVAKWTPEMKSWFFKAQRYDYVLDIDAFVLRFLERLDAEIDEQDPASQG